MQNKQITPWAYIPTAYFLEGLPYIVINFISTVIYTNMGLKEDYFMFWTGFLYLPWILKMFWAPLVEGNKTKRSWVILTQYLLALVFLLIGLTLKLDNFFIYSLAGFFAGTLISATHDIALDGYYMIVLSEKQQAFFVGWRTIFYRFAMLFGSGPLVVIAGKLESASGSVPLAWLVILACIAASMVILNTYHMCILPKPVGDVPQKSANTPLYADVFKAYFTQKNVVYILLFILVYRLGDAFLEKMIVSFIRKDREFGGLGLSTETLGYIKGTLGLLGIMAGNIIGGWLLSKFGFRKCIWWFAAILVMPNFLYLYMAYTDPQMPLITVFIVLEHFGNGLAMMAFTLFILLVSRGKYKTSFYAISTSIMGLGMMLPSMYSGKLFVWLGESYEKFFLLVSLASLVTFIIIPLTYKIDQMKEADKVWDENKTLLSDD